MSETLSLPVDSPAEALDAATRALEAGDADRLADAFLARLQGEALWEADVVASALRELRNSDALLPALGGALAAGDDAARRNAARTALAVLGQPGSFGAASTIQALAALARTHEDADVRVLAATALGETGNRAAAEPLIGAVEDPEPNVAAAAVDALGTLGDARALDTLIARVTRGDHWVRMGAILALGSLRDAAAVPTLSAALEDDALAPAALEAIAEIAAPSGLAALERAARSRAELRPQILHAAVSILAANPGLAPPDWLRPLAGPDVDEARGQLSEGDETAARLLGIAGTDPAAAALVDAFHREELWPAAGCGAALLPEDVARRAILQALQDVRPAAAAALTAALPPLASADDVRALLPQLGSPRPAARSAAAEALGRSDHETVRPLLLEALRDPERRAAAVFALGKLGDTPCEQIAELLDDEQADVRRSAADALARCDSTPVRRRVLDALANERDPLARRALISATGAAGGKEGVRALAALLEEDDPAVRFAATHALGDTGDETALPHLLRALADPAEEIQAAALHALGRLGDPRGTQPLTEHLDASDREIRRTAAGALATLASPEAIERLRRALDDADWEVRLAAVRTLRRLDVVTARTDLDRLGREDPDPLVRSEARRATDDAGQAGAR